MVIKRIFSLTNLALVSFLVFYGVKLFYGIVTRELGAAIISGSLEKAPVISTQRGIDSRSPARQNFSVYKPIVTRDLFKTQRAQNTGKDTITASKIEHLRKTELKVALWGTITGNAGSEYAVIEDKSRREQQLYPEGGSIKNARIKMILRKRVVLSVEGQDEILEMEKTIEREHEMPGDNIRKANIPDDDLRDAFNYKNRERKKKKIRREMAQKY